MEQERKKQEINALRTMRQLRADIDGLNKQIKKLDKEAAHCDLDENEYSTDNVSLTKSLKDMARKEAFKRVDEEEKREIAKFKLIPWLGLAVGAAVIIFLKNLWIGLAVAVGGFIVKMIAQAPAKSRSKKKFNVAMDAIEKEYEKRLDEAAKHDEAERARFEADRKVKLKEKQAEVAPKIAHLKDERADLEKQYNEIKVISEKDVEKDHDIIDKVLDLMESNRADTVKEALQEIDREKQRKAREAKEAMEREQARLASLPGKVYFCIGSINTYSGKLQSVRNTIYVDGAPYGAGSPMISSIQLNPGPHSIYAQLQEAGYVFTTPTYSFNMEGNGSIYLKIMIKNARAAIYPYATEKDLLNDI